MSIEIKRAAATLISCEMSKKTGVAATTKKIDLDVDVSGDEILAALDEVFSGLSTLTQSVAMTEGSPIVVEGNIRGDVALIVYGSDGHTEVLKIDTGKVKGSVKVKIGAKAETVRMRLRVAGSVKRDTLAKIDDYLGADVVVGLKTLQLDIEEEAKKKSTKKQKVTLEVGQAH